MSELPPHFKAKVSERNWFVVRHEESFACSCPCGHEVLDGEDVRVRDIADVGHVP